MLLLALIVALFPGVQAQMMPECPTEGSVNCVWHAENHGNGLGLTYVNYSHGDVFVQVVLYDVTAQPTN